VHAAATHCNTLQHTTTHCNTLQHTATHCNTLQHTATHCNTLQEGSQTHKMSKVRTFETYIPGGCEWATVPTAKTYCNTLQHTATHYSTLQQDTATHKCLLCWVWRKIYWVDANWYPCIPLQHTATHRNILQQDTATHKMSVVLTFEKYTLGRCEWATWHAAAAHCNKLPNTATRHCTATKCLYCWLLRRDIYIYIHHIYHIYHIYVSYIYIYMYMCTYI